ncbi:MAG TPA: class I SAM-dependent methyltransferase, partial [Syntrophales bacterium]|nr:class I SAM-dependent methyltransferase [Syntrophales bacterium]
SVAAEPPKPLASKAHPLAMLADLLSEEAGQPPVRQPLDDTADNSCLPAARQAGQKHMLGGRHGTDYIAREHLPDGLLHEGPLTLPVAGWLTRELDCGLNAARLRGTVGSGHCRKRRVAGMSENCGTGLPGDGIRRFSALDIPRIFNITESAHRIHNPFTPEKLATLGAALRLESGTRVLDLGSGSGEMLCTWARDYGVIGTGIDMSQLFTEQAKLRAEELGVADQVKFTHGDAAGYVSDEKVGVAACVGATWIAGGVVGTIELLAQSLRTGGIILIGEPYWRQLPPTEDVAKGCLAGSISDFLMLPELLASFGRLGYDVVEMVLADQDSWDRYEAAKWLTMRRWLEANPDDEFAKDVRAQLTSEPERYAAYTREYLGWGVFALMTR